MASGLCKKDCKETLMGSRKKIVFSIFAQLTYVLVAGCVLPDIYNIT